MQIRKALAVCALALSGALTASQASAQFFVGGSVGQSDMDDEITNGLITSGTVDSKDTAWKIFGGYMFNRHFGVDASKRLTVGRSTGCSVCAGMQAEGCVPSYIKR